MKKETVKVDEKMIFCTVKIVGIFIKIEIWRKNVFFETTCVKKNKFIMSEKLLPVEEKEN
jgi:hypothetical protein